MIKFIKFIWKYYKKEERIKKAQEEYHGFIAEMKNMNGVDMRTKWGNPVKVFTDFKWKLYCAKNDIIKCDKCKRFHKEDFKC